MGFRTEKEAFFGMSTFIVSASAAAANSRWHVIDADGRVLGRIATQAALLLQVKHKATYTPFIDTGDHVVVVNAAKVKLTGRKEDQKIYRQHSGYEGGLREERARTVRAKRPERRRDPARAPGLGAITKPSPLAVPISTETWAITGHSRKSGVGTLYRVGFVT